MIQWTLFWNPSMWGKNHTRNREESCHYRRANGRDVKEGRLEVDAWCVRHSQTCCPVLFDDWPVEFLEHGHPHLRYCSTYYIGQNCAFLLSTAWVCYLMLFEKQPFWVFGTCLSTSEVLQYMLCSTKMCIPPLYCLGLMYYVVWGAASWVFGTWSSMSEVLQYMLCRTKMCIPPLYCFGLLY